MPHRLKNNGQRVRRTTETSIWLKVFVSCLFEARFALVGYGKYSIRSRSHSTPSSAIDRGIATPSIKSTPRYVQLPTSRSTGNISDAIGHPSSHAIPRFDRLPSSAVLSRHFRRCPSSSFPSGNFLPRRFVVSQLVHAFLLHQGRYRVDAMLVRRRPGSRSSAVPHNLFFAEFCNSYFPLSPSTASGSRRVLSRRGERSRRARRQSLTKLSAARSLLSLDSELRVFRFLLVSLPSHDSTKTSLLNTAHLLSQQL